jgi:hypothetical protein
MVRLMTWCLRFALRAAPGRADARREILCSLCVQNAALCVEKRLALDRAVSRGAGRSGASIKRRMGGSDGFAGMAGVGYRKL